MNHATKCLFLFFCILFLFACKRHHNEINALENMISKAEINLDTLNENDWNDLNQKIQTLKVDFEKNPNFYSKEETERIEILNSKYVEVLETKEGTDYNENLDEWSRIIRDAADNLEDSLKR